ncbi:Membrane transporter Tim44-related/Ribosomal protein L45 [Macrophomina phaseolina MS6]|uniref:Mitochondrial import inner membrane translocase subunit TIM44 n=1 Tax=Macrophomina phaseolina (strain MS6) TaxID=1126212 RepID=K2RYC4_MACPH|nr:Membrane transporter Tim44-related/Ribosomal protein L45 [Macrophomina phaseolina MS6]
MKAFASSSVGARVGGAARSSLSSSTAAYGRSAACRRLSTAVLQSQRVSSPQTTPFSSSPSSLPFLRSQIQPQDILLRSSALYARHFHAQSALNQEAKKADPTSSTEEKERASDGDKTKSSTANSETGEKKKAEGEGEGEQQQGEGEEKDGSQKKDDKKDAPPPPPHGDKTPWQVFTETLKTEFQASKEWNESTKQLAAGVEDFTQNENVKRARSAYKSAAEAAGSTTSTVLKKTGSAIGQSAAWTWDTAPVRVLRKGASATGRGIEKITRPVRQTEAYKNVKDVIDDGSSSRYGGWVEKEERRKKREERDIKSGRPKVAEKMEEDPNAGTNITLHKDAAWKASWNEFRENSRLMQSLFAMKANYRESENPLISTARSISDRVAGFFAENETAMVIKKFKEMDPTFQLEPFLTEMREYILPEVLDAYVKGDTEVLKMWLSAAQYQVYAALMQQYTTAGLKSAGRIFDIRNVEILNARLLDPGEIPVFIVTCRTQEVHVFKNAKSGELAAGMDDKVQQVTYAIGVTRIPEDVNNPETRGWRLIEMQKSARDYI